MKIRKQLTMKKQTIADKKWSGQITQLLTSLEMEINTASQIQSIKDLEISINQKEFQEQLKDIDSLLLSWIRDLKFWQCVYRK